MFSVSSVILKNCELSTPELPPGMRIVLLKFLLLVLVVVKNACPAANYTLVSELIS
jgi:hypothetical protein